MDHSLIDGAEVVRKMNSYEMVYEEFNKLGLLNVGYEMDFGFKKLPETDLLLKALRITQRKIPTLSLCIRKKEEEMFFCQATDLQIDFKVVKNQSRDNLITKTLAMPFESHNGPLWRTRLLLPAKVEENDKYPHKCFILMCFHHAMTDGFSNTTTVNCFMFVLDSLMAAIDVDEGIVGKLSNTLLFDTRLREIEEKWKINPQMKQMADDKYNPILTHESELWKLPENQRQRENGSQLIRRVLDIKDTSRLLQSCKQMHVTFNSLFHAVMNKTLYQVIGDKDSSRKENCAILFLEAVTLRRPNTGFDDDLGCLVCIHSGMNSWNREVADDFEGFTKDFHQKMRSDLQNKSFFDEEAFKGIKLGDLFSFPSKPTYDYHTSNSGDMSKIVKASREHIELYDVFRSTNLHFFGGCFSVLFHTFRGKLYMTFLRIKKFMDEEIFRLIIEKFQQNLQQLRT